MLRALTTVTIIFGGVPLRLVKGESVELSPEAAEWLLGCGYIRVEPEPVETPEQKLPAVERRKRKS